MDDFVKRVDAQLDDLRADDARFAAQQEDIARKRAAVQQRVEALTRSVAVYVDVMGLSASARHLSSKVAKDGAQPTVADLSEQLIRDRDRPMSVNELADELRALGKLKSGGASGRSDYGIVYKSINRNKRFRRVRPGTYDVDRGLSRK